MTVELDSPVPRSREEVYRTHLELMYSLVADVLYENAASPQLVARMADKFDGAPYFDASDFKEQAYGPRRSHP